jgi:polyisoprenoid-binding protein YceI
VKALLLLALALGEPRFALERFLLDSAASSIGFDGSSTLHDFTACAGRFGGEARVDFGNFSPTAGAEVWVETSSLDSGSEGRDEDMKELLEEKRYPRIAFRLSEIEGKLEGRKGELRARGTFAIRGVQREREVRLRLEPRGDGFRAIGEARFKMSEHGIRPPRMLLIKTADAVRAWFDVVFAKAHSSDVAASARPLEVEEKRSEGSSPQARWSGRVWVAQDAVVVERTGAPVWLLSSGGAARAIDARSALRLGPPPPPKPPAEGAASIERDERHVTIRIGEVEWASFEELRGEEPFPAALVFFEGIPEPVRAALRELRGVPRKTKLRCASPDRTVSLSIGEPESGSLPDWVVHPESWTRARTEDGR